MPALKTSVGERHQRGPLRERLRSREARNDDITTALVGIVTSCEPLGSDALARFAIAVAAMAARTAHAEINEKVLQASFSTCSDDAIPYMGVTGTFGPSFTQQTSFR